MNKKRIVELHGKLAERIKDYELAFSRPLPIEVHSEIRYALRAIMEIWSEELGDNPSEEYIQEAMIRVYHALICGYHDLFDGVKYDCTRYLRNVVVEMPDASSRVLGDKRNEILNDLHQVGTIVKQSRNNLKERPDFYEKLYDQWFDKLLAHKTFLEISVADVIKEHDRIGQELKEAQVKEKKAERKSTYSLIFAGVSLLVAILAFIFK